MCPDLSKPGARWNDIRVIFFTEYDDTKRYLHEQLSAAIEGSDRAGQRIAIYHGPTPPDEREEIKRSFNKPPAEHPVRILIATDAAREGLNLQAHCWNLFHFDVPWNPSRMEQRNGRIDRKLQPKDDVYCHYFFYCQRPEDRILAVLVKKTVKIKEELGSLAQVIEERLADQMQLGTLGTFSEFAAMQSRVHEVWAKVFASSLEDRWRYNTSDCFETFPFPKGLEQNPALEQVGREYYDFRAALMVRNNEGLTKTYNRFHDANETSPGIIKLRELHAAMDRAVLDAYGWTDLKPTCEFLLDYEEEDEDENGAASKRKKPWRYRWPDEFRDEVLARLLELNKKRAEEEAVTGVAGAGATAATGKKTSAKARTRKSNRASDEQDGGRLFAE